MRLLLLTLFFAQCIFSFSQEMESDLHLALNHSSLHIFKASEKSKMMVKTLRNSKKNGTVEETSSTYRKGKINPLKISFNVSYTEFFILEDRKKSLGKYFFNDKNQIRRYERTDFDNRNQRSVTFYIYYRYSADVLEREILRTREYIGQGSAEQDSIVYVDTTQYEVKPIEKGFHQANLSDDGVYAEYDTKDDKLLKKTNFFPGFNEIISYTYDSNGHLIKIENKLINEDEGGEHKSITTRTEIHYSIDGLVTEAIFYDELDQILERKIYTYK
jgi:hypothetical protein